MVETVRFRLAEIAERLDGELRGDGNLPILGVAGIREAQAGEIAFLGDPRYEDWLVKTRASAIILPRNHPYNGRPGIGVKEPYEAFHLVMEMFHPKQRSIAPGIHSSALVGRDVKCGKNAAVGAYVIIGDRCRIGENTTIFPGVVIAADVSIGHDCLIYANVVLREGTELGTGVIVHAGTVIGADGFGFLNRGGEHHKVPQLGRVVIEDDVEIGANTCIDRATVGATIVRKGTRIDNLVQVAHNVTIGRHSILCAQVGIAGSTTVGDSVTLAGQVGIVGHIEIGDQAMVGAQGGVTKSVPPGAQVSGYPAAPHSLAKRMYAAMRQLPNLLKEVRELKRRLDELDGKED